MSNFSTIPKICKLNYNNSTFVPTMFMFSLAGNINAYIPLQGTKSEIYFSHIIYEGKMLTLAGSKQLSVHFFFHRSRLFYISTEKCTGLIRLR